MDFKRELECSEMLYKRFSKMNRKREKKGQPLLTQDEFTKIIRKENRVYSKKTAWLLEAFFAFIVVFASTARDGIAYGIDLSDLIFAGIMFLIIFGAFHISFQSSQMMSAAKLEILERCEKQGIDIVTYWEDL